MLRSRVVLFGLIGLAVLVAGHFGSYTFIRTAAEGVSGLTPATIAVLLAVYGVGGLLGNVLTGLVADRHLGVALVMVPVLIAAGHHRVLAVHRFRAPRLRRRRALGHGLRRPSPPRRRPGSPAPSRDRVEAAGGLVVATFQLAIALGAALGGLLLDTTSVQTVFLAGGVAVVLGGALLASTSADCSPSVAS